MSTPGSTSNNNPSKMVERMHAMVQHLDSNKDQLPGLSFAHLVASAEMTPVLTYVSTACRGYFHIAFGQPNARRCHRPGSLLKRVRTFHPSRVIFLLTHYLTISITITPACTLTSPPRPICSFPTPAFKRHRDTGFTTETRQTLGLRGLLPPAIETLDEQMYRVLDQMRVKRTTIGKVSTIHIHRCCCHHF